MSTYSFVTGFTSNIPISIHVIIEGELFVLHYFPFREYTHAHPFTDLPLGNVCVWVAGVVDEASDSAFLGGVDILRG